MDRISKPFVCGPAASYRDVQNMKAARPALRTKQPTLEQELRVYWPFWLGVWIALCVASALLTYLFFAVQP